MAFCDAKAVRHSVTSMVSKLRFLFLSLNLLLLFYIYFPFIRIEFTDNLLLSVFSMNKQTFLSTLSTDATYSTDSTQEENEIAITTAMYETISPSQTFWWGGDAVNNTKSARVSDTLWVTPHSGDIEALKAVSTSLKPTCRFTHIFFLLSSLWISLFETKRNLAIIFF